MNHRLRKVLSILLCLWQKCTKVYHKHPSLCFLFFKRTCKKRTGMKIKGERNVWHEMRERKEQSVTQAQSKQHSRERREGLEWILIRRLNEGNKKESWERLVLLLTFLFICDGHLCLLYRETGHHSSHERRRRSDGHTSDEIMLYFCSTGKTLLFIRWKQNEKSQEAERRGNKLLKYMRQKFSSSRPSLAVPKADKAISSFSSRCLLQFNPLRGLLCFQSSQE